MASTVAGFDDDEGVGTKIDGVGWRFGKDPFLAGPGRKEDGPELLEVPSRGQTDGVVVGDNDPGCENGEYG